MALPDGSKEPLHRHNWLVAAEVCSSNLGKTGIVMDFHKLKDMLDNIVSQLTDIPLDKMSYFKKNGSSAEIVAKYIYEKLEAELPKNVKLNHIKVTEQPGCTAKFTK